MVLRRKTIRLIFSSMMSHTDLFPSVMWPMWPLCCDFVGKCTKDSLQGERSRRVYLTLCVYCVYTIHCVYVDLAGDRSLPTLVRYSSDLVKTENKMEDETAARTCPVSTDLCCVFTDYLVLSSCNTFSFHLPSPLPMCPCLRFVLPTAFFHSIFGLSRSAPPAAKLTHRVPEVGLIFQSASVSISELVAFPPTTRVIVRVSCTALYAF